MEKSAQDIANEALQLQQALADFFAGETRARITLEYLQITYGETVGKILFDLLHIA